MDTCITVEAFIDAAPSAMAVEGTLLVLRLRNTIGTCVQKSDPRCSWRATITLRLILVLDLTNY